MQKRKIYNMLIRALDAVFIAWLALIGLYYIKAVYLAKFFQTKI